MPRYLQCVEFDESTQTCTSEAFVQQEFQPIPDWYPTVDQAQTVGGVMFTAIVIIASMCLLLPPKDNYDE
jgi:hypothetical protein